MQNQGEINASGNLLKEIFLDCIISRTRKSLEHLKRFIEVFYSEIFQPWFVESKEGQQVAVRTVAKIWQNQPERAILVIEKLWQLGIVEAENAVEWAFKSLRTAD